MNPAPQIEVEIVATLRHQEVSVWVTDSIQAH